MDARRLDDLLEKTSRTFALTIPRLPDPTRREVAIAYLLFRIADTLEDATLWSAARKAEELEALTRLLENPTIDAAADRSRRWSSDPPVEHAGYLELLSELPGVLDAALRLRPEASRLVIDYTLRTTREMRAFVLRAPDGVLRLRDLSDLRRYCYAVAGIVGEMLTELFVLGRASLAEVADALRADAARFGEALQLVNILKDEGTDATEGRRFLPDGVSRSEVVDLARGDLACAAGYCARLERAACEPGLIAFNVLPLLLAEATLARVEADGSGSKLSRAEVGEIVRGLDDALARGSASTLVGAAATSVTSQRESSSRARRSPAPARE